MSIVKLTEYLFSLQYNTKTQFFLMKAENCEKGEDKLREIQRVISLTIILLLLPEFTDSVTAEYIIFVIHVR